VPGGDDTVAMVACLQALGIGVTMEGTDAVVDGSSGVIGARDVVLDAKLAGTTSRFVTALATLGAGPITIDGAPPLRRRPMGPLHDALAGLGVAIGERGAHEGPVGDALRAGHGHDGVERARGRGQTEHGDARQLKRVTAGRKPRAMRPPR
jgi:hypothetical protein